MMKHWPLAAGTMRTCAPYTASADVAFFGVEQKPTVRFGVTQVGAPSGNQEDGRRSEVSLDSMPHLQPMLTSSIGQLHLRLFD